MKQYIFSGWGKANSWLLDFLVLLQSTPIYIVWLCLNSKVVLYQIINKYKIKRYWCRRTKELDRQPVVLVKTRFLFMGNTNAILFLVQLTLWSSKGSFYFLSKLHQYLSFCPNSSCKTARKTMLWKKKQENPKYLQIGAWFV